MPRRRQRHDSRVEREAAGPQRQLCGDEAVQEL